MVKSINKTISIQSLKEVGVKLKSPERATARLSVLDISPLPKVPVVNEQGRKRKLQKLELITSSPFKKSLTDKVAVDEKILLTKQAE